MGLAKDSETELTLLEHLQEVRQRLIYCLIALIIALIPTIFFANNLFEILLVPAPGGFKPVFTEMTEMLFTYFKVALLGGATLAMPVFIYNIIAFVLPALKSSEKRLLYLLMPMVVLFFAAGLAFSYFILLPFAVNYLLNFSGVAAPMIKIGNYITFVVALLLGMGAAFQTPVVLFILAKMGVVDHQKLGHFRRYALLVVFLIAAVITPTPDPINQSVVGVSLYALFELGILFTRFARPPTTRFTEERDDHS